MLIFSYIGYVLVVHDLKSSFHYQQTHIDLQTIWIVHDWAW